MPLYAERHRKNPLFSTFNGLTFYVKKEAISRSCNILILKWNKTRDRWQQRLMSGEVSWLFSRHAKVSWGIINPRCTGSIAFQLPEWVPERGGGRSCRVITQRGELLWQAVEAAVLKFWNRYVSTTGDRRLGVTTPGRSHPNNTAKKVMGKHIRWGVGTASGELNPPDVFAPPWSDCHTPHNYYTPGVNAASSTGEGHLRVFWDEKVTQLPAPLKRKAEPSPTLHTHPRASTVIPLLL